MGVRVQTTATLVHVYWWEGEATDMSCCMQSCVVSEGTLLNGSVVTSQVQLSLCNYKRSYYSPSHYVCFIYTSAVGVLLFN